MSGLNDDVDAEVEQELPGSDKQEVTIDQFKTGGDAGSGQTSSNTSSVILKIGDDMTDENGQSITPSIKDLFGDNVVPNQLPDLKAKILMIQTGSNTISDATSALNAIKQSGTISQEDVKEIDAILPGYLNDTECIEYYTKSPTITRHATAIGKVSVEIAQRNKEQTNLTVDTFMLLKDSVVATIEFIEQALLDTAKLKKDKLAPLVNYISSNASAQALAGQQCSVLKAISSSLECESGQCTAKTAALLQKALEIVKRPTAFATLLNRSIFLRKSLDQYFVFDCLGSANNLAQTTVNATVKELMEYTYSDDKDVLSQLLLGILVSAITYIDDCVDAIKNKEATDIGKEHDPLNILNRESGALVSVRVLVASILEFDEVMLELAEAFSKAVKSPS